VNTIKERIENNYIHVPLETVHIHVYALSLGFVFVPEADATAEKMMRIIVNQC